MMKERKKKGNQRKCLPEPNPAKIEMSKHSSIFEVSQNLSNYTTENFLMLQ